MSHWQVVSNCRHHRRYDLIIHHKPGTTLPASVECSCESGRYRGSTYPVPCKHAALVLRSAERRNWVEWHEGLWWNHSAWQERVRRLNEAPSIPDDPFAGLVPEEDEA